MSEPPSDRLEIAPEAAEIGPCSETAQFFRAIANGEERVVKQYLRRGGDPSASLSHIQGFHVAIANSRCRMFEILRDQGVLLSNTTGPSRWTMGGDGLFLPQPLPPQKRHLLWGYCLVAKFLPQLARFLCCLLVWSGFIYTFAFLFHHGTHALDIFSFIAFVCFVVISHKLWQQLLVPLFFRTVTEWFRLADAVRPPTIDVPARISPVQFANSFACNLETFLWVVSDCLLPDPQPREAEALFHAVLTQNERGIRRFLSNGRYADQIYDGVSVAHLCCDNDMDDLLHLLRSYSANLDQPTMQGGRWVRLASGLWAPLPLAGWDGGFFSRFGFAFKSFLHSAAFLWPLCFVAFTATVFLVINLLHCDKTTGFPFVAAPVELSIPFVHVWFRFMCAVAVYMSLPYLSHQTASFLSPCIGTRLNWLPIFWHSRVRICRYSLPSTVRAGLLLLCLWLPIVLEMYTAAWLLVCWLGILRQTRLPFSYFSFTLDQRVCWVPRGVTPLAMASMFNSVECDKDLRNPSADSDEEDEALVDDGLNIFSLLYKELAGDERDDADADYVPDRLELSDKSEEDSRLGERADTDSGTEVGLSGSEEAEDDDEEGEIESEAEIEDTEEASLLSDLSVPLSSLVGGNADLSARCSAPPASGDLTFSPESIRSLPRLRPRSYQSQSQSQAASSASALSSVTESMPSSASSARSSGDHCNSAEVFPERVREFERKYLCIACQSADKNVALIPCNHICFCDTCAQLFQRTDRDASSIEGSLGVTAPSALRCPACRRQVRGYRRVFF